jgi:inner membrane protein
MTWPTHTLLGICTLWLLAPLPPDMIGYDMGTLAACAAFGALLPDLDASESKIKHLKLLGTQIKPFLLPSQVIYKTDQHRGLLHSLIGFGMVTGLFTPLGWWIGWAPIVVVLFGYASHLLADSATKSGLRLFYPRPDRFYLMPRGWRVTTGSPAEDGIMVSSAVMVLILLLSQLHGL